MPTPSEKLAHSLEALAKLQTVQSRSVRGIYPERTGSGCSHKVFSSRF
jgi:hypothetical protein